MMILERNEGGLHNQRKYWRGYPRKMKNQNTEIKGDGIKQ